MRNYKQLSQAQRYQIEILNKAGKNQKETAELLGAETQSRQKGLLPEAETDKRRTQAAKSAKNDRRSHR